MDKEIYKALATAIIKKQADIIGRELAVKKAQKIKELLVADEGDVMVIGKTPVITVSSLIREYMSLSGEAAVIFSQEATECIIQENPELKIPPELQKSFIQAASLKDVLAKGFR